VQLVVGCGGELFPSEPDVLLVRYAPQFSILERARVFVCHGGANGIMEALYHGTPPLVVPLVNDAPVQAAFVDQAEVGLQVPPADLSVDRVRTALRDLLDPSGAFQVRAARLGEEYRRRDGARRSAELLVKLAATRGPIPALAS
jgi:UDP:flavonoid glycosyltransferase YjiC (YdhE family)